MDEEQEEPNLLPNGKHPLTIFGDEFAEWAYCVSMNEKRQLWFPRIGVKAGVSLGQAIRDLLRKATEMAYTRVVIPQPPKQVMKISAQLGFRYSKITIDDPPEGEEEWQGQEFLVMLWGI